MFVLSWLTVFRKIMLRVLILISIGSGKWRARQAQYLLPESKSEALIRFPALLQWSVQSQGYRWKEWGMLLSVAGNGAVISGEKDTLTEAVLKGADVRYRMNLDRLSPGEGYSLLYTADNLELRTAMMYLQCTCARLPEAPEECSRNRFLPRCGAVDFHALWYYGQCPGWFLEGWGARHTFKWTSSLPHWMVYKLLTFHTEENDRTYRTLARVYQFQLHKTSWCFVFLSFLYISSP